jgi:hypothetical protein
MDPNVCYANRSIYFHFIVCLDGFMFLKGMTSIEGVLKGVVAWTTYHYPKVEKSFNDYSVMEPSTKYDVLLKHFIWKFVRSCLVLLCQCLLVCKLFKHVNYFLPKNFIISRLLETFPSSILLSFNCLILTRSIS